MHSLTPSTAHLPVWSYATSRWAAAGIAWLAMAGVGCSHRAAKLDPDLLPESQGARITHSNILRADYAGSESCRPCHQSLYTDWLGSPMRQMTRRPTTGQIRAPFDGRTWNFKGDQASFEQHGEVHFMRTHTQASGDHLYRITRVIGGRTREDFAGLEVGGTQPDEPVIGDAHNEAILPVSYFFETTSFRCDETFFVIWNMSIC